MREHWSVFKLQVRRKMPKALLVFFFVMVAGILGYLILGFRHNDAAEMQKFLDDIVVGDAMTETIEKAPRSFANGGSSVYLEILCVIGFFGVAWACVDFPVKKFRTAYTVRRLQTSETSLFWWDALINSALFLAMWACAIALIFIAGRIYESGAGFVEGPQGIAASIARNAFYRGVVPIAYPWVALRNVVAAICCGFACAGASYRIRNRMMPVLETVILVAVLFAIPFAIERYTMDQKAVFWSIVSGWLWKIPLVVLACVLVVRDSRRRKEA